jgi:hypothetical protein
VWTPPAVPETAPVQGSRSRAPGAGDISMAPTEGRRNTKIAVARSWAAVKPMLSHEQAICGDGRAVIFNNNKDRDAFREVAEQHGGAYEEGNGFLVETSHPVGL